MKRWVPFAIALFMLMPFGLWLGLGLFGPGGGMVALQSDVGGVLLLTSLPFAGLFWVQNLRQLGDSMGAPSRLRLAERLAGLLPLAVLGLGGLGALWLLASADGYAAPFLALLGTLVMAGFGRLIARAPVEPGRIIPSPEPQRDDRAVAHGWLLFIGNITMALGLLAYAWTPWVLLWSLFVIVPVAFTLMLMLAWWAAKTDVHPVAPAAPADPANDGAALAVDRAA